MTNQERREQLDDSARALLIGLELSGFIVTVKGKGPEAASYVAAHLANIEEHGIDQAANIFDVKNDYSEEDPLNKFVKDRILELKK